MAVYGHPARRGVGEWQLWRNQQLLDIDTDGELAPIFQWAENVIHCEDHVEVRQWIKKSAGSAGVIGKLDAKSDRKAGTLTLNALHEDVRFTNAMCLPSFKRCRNRMTIELSTKLADTAIKVTLVCPGFVQTDLTPVNREQAPLTARARQVRRGCTGRSVPTDPPSSGLNPPELET